MPRSMVPFPYSPWPFLDFGQDPDPNGAPPLPNAPVPNVPGVTIPWSALPPIAPPSAVPSPVVPPPNIPAQPTLPPSDTPGFDKTFAPQSPPPPVAQPPRNPSLADIIAPWMQPPEPEPPPPALPPSETPGLDKAIARMNAPTPGFHLTPGLGGFSQPPMWSLPPPPQLLPIPPLPVPPRSGGLGTLGSTLPPMAPALSPLIRTSGGPAALTAGPLSGTEAGAGIPETLTQMARRLMPFATRLGAAATAAGQIALEPWNQQDSTVDLGSGLRLRKQLDPGPATLEQYRPGAIGIGGRWQRLPIDARTTLDNGSYEQLQVDPDQLRAVLGEELANRLLDTPGIMPMAKRPSDKQPKLPPSDNSNGGSPSNGGGPPDGTDVAAAIAREVLIGAAKTAIDPVRIANMLRATARGRQFQKDVLAALEVPENKDRTTVTIDGGKLVTVIPDAQSTTLITEAKDVVNLSNSNQFRGYFAARKPINLIVSPNTQTISKPLQGLIRRSEGSITVFDPATKTFTPWVPK